MRYEKATLSYSMKLKDHFEENIDYKNNTNLNIKNINDMFVLRGKLAVSYNEGNFFPLRAHLRKTILHFELCYHIMVDEKQFNCSNLDQ